MKKTITMAYAAILAACAATVPPGANPDDMSAAEHRQHAAKHQHAATEHEGRYEEGASQPLYRGSPEMWDAQAYNPTKKHLDHAREHAEHAAAHRAAATKLEQYEEHECKKFPKQTRAVCPLLNTVAATADVAHGVVVTLSPKVDRRAVLDHLRCHVAFAKTQGGTGMPQCPMYLPGVKVELGTAEHTVRLTVADDGQVPELRRRAKEHVSP